MQAAVEGAALPKQQFHHKPCGNFPADVYLLPGGLLKAQLEQVVGYREPGRYPALYHLARLRRDIGDDLLTAAALGVLFYKLHHPCGVDVPGDGQHHVPGIIKSVVAAVQQLVSDVGNAFLRACNVGFHRQVVVQPAQQPEKHLPAGIVVIHGDFLADDALLLLHRLRCKVRGGDKVQQDVQRLVNIVAGGEQVAGLIK